MTLLYVYIACVFIPQLAQKDHKKVSPKFLFVDFSQKIKCSLYIAIKVLSF